MARLLRMGAVQAIATEVSKPHLAAQGCSEAALLGRIGGAGFEVSGAYQRQWSYDVQGVAPWVKALAEKVERKARGE